MGTIRSNIMVALRSGPKSEEILRRAAGGDRVPHEVFHGAMMRLQRDQLVKREGTFWRSLVTVKIEPPPPSKPEALPMDTYSCSRCGKEDIPEDQFPKTRVGNPGTICSECRSEAGRKGAAKRIEQQRQKALAAAQVEEAPKLPPDHDVVRLRVLPGAKIEASRILKIPTTVGMLELELDEGVTKALQSELCKL